MSSMINSNDGLNCDDKIVRGGKTKRLKINASKKTTTVAPNRNYYEEEENVLSC